MAGHYQQLPHRVLPDERELGAGRHHEDVAVLARELDAPPGRLAFTFGVKAGPEGLNGIGRRCRRVPVRGSGNTRLFLIGGAPAPRLARSLAGPQRPTPLPRVRRLCFDPSRRMACDSVVASTTRRDGVTRSTHGPATRFSAFVRRASSRAAPAHPPGAWNWYQAMFADELRYGLRRARSRRRTVKSGLR